MSQFRHDGFVGGDTIKFMPSNHGIMVQGEIACKGGIVIRVNKCLRIVPPHSAQVVETAWYAYNASIRGGQNILRYDNQDEDSGFRGHPDPHHKHVFNWKTGDTIEVQWVGADRWPKLNEVIEELREWYWVHKNQLPDPDDYPELDLR